MAYTGPPPPHPDDFAESIFSEDDHTLPGYDDEDAYSLSNASVSSLSSYASFDIAVPRRPYRVPREDGFSKPVYEAWVVYRSPSNLEKLSSNRVLGMNFHSAWRYHYGGTSETAVDIPQAELADMHLNALDVYHGSQKSCLPFRKRKTYEQDLDERIRKAPDDVQRHINRLLSDRETATGTPWRTRDWTVVMMREQLHRRFASAEPEPVNRHRIRRWKNNDRGQPTEFFCIIRGLEGKVANDDLGFPAYLRDTNPWKHLDQDDRLARHQSWRTKKLQEKGKMNIDPPLRRRPPPPAPRYAPVWKTPPPHPVAVAPQPPPAPTYPPPIWAAHRGDTPLPPPPPRCVFGPASVPPPPPPPPPPVLPRMPSYASVPPSFIPAGFPAPGANPPPPVNFNPNLMGRYTSPAPIPSPLAWHCFPPGPLPSSGYTIPPAPRPVVPSVPYQPAQPLNSWRYHATPPCLQAHNQGPTPTNPVPIVSMHPPPFVPCVPPQPPRIVNVARFPSPAPSAPMSEPPSPHELVNDGQSVMSELEGERSVDD